MPDSIAEAEIDHLRARFVSDDVESEYRDFTADDTRLSMTLALGTLAIPTALFAHSDYMLFGLTSTFWMLLCVRLATVVFTIITVAVQISRWPIIRKDASVLLLVLVLCVGASYINSTRPSSYVHFVPIDICLILVFYVLLRVRWWYQLAMAATLTTCDLILLIFFKDADLGIGGSAIYVSFFVANTLGAFASWQIHIYGRAQYRAFKSIRRLEGFIPLCAQCKKVRNDEGFWTQIAEYIDRETDAQVTHGLCPECLAEHMSDIDDDK